MPLPWHSVSDDCLSPLPGQNHRVQLGTEREMESLPPALAPKGSSVRTYSFEIVEQSKRLRADWRSYFSEHIRGGGSELWHDLRSVRWLRFLIWTSFLAWIVAIVMAVYFACVGSLTFVSYSDNGLYDSPEVNCLPDGSFSLSPSLYDVWRPSGFFQITLGSGDFTFGMAKFIDITFDIVVGRGGQVLLAFVSGRVFAHYITAQMEITPVSYGTYKTVFLREGPTFWSTIGLMREFVCYRALNSKLAMTWMVLSASFIVAFPTLVSAMSGYSGNSAPFVPDPETQNLLRWQDFSQVDYVVHDGSRIGLSDDFALTENDEDCYKQNPLVQSYYTSNVSDPYGSIAWNNSICKTRLDVSDYVRRYGFFGLGTTNSTYRNYSLPSPILNISAFYISPDHDSRNSIFSVPNVYGNNWTDPRTGLEPLKNESHMTYVTINSNQTFPSAYVSANGQCQPIGTYKWGFSFLILFISLVCLFIWTIGTYTLWLKAHFTLRSREESSIAGEYKAVVELAESVTSSFRSLGEKPETLSESQIRRRIRTELKGGKMLYQSPLRCEPYRFWPGFKRWCKRDKWWIAALLAAIFVISISGVYYVFGLQIFAGFVFIGLLCARWICSTPRSIAFMISIWVACGAIAGPSTIAGIQNSL